MKCVLQMSVTGINIRLVVEIVKGNFSKLSTLFVNGMKLFLYYWSFIDQMFTRLIAIIEKKNKLTDLQLD